MGFYLLKRIELEQEVPWQSGVENKAMLPQAKLIQLMLLTLNGDIALTIHVASGV